MKRFCHKSKTDHHRPLIRCLLYRKVPQATELQNFSLAGGACRLLTSSSDEVVSPSYHPYYGA